MKRSAYPRSWLIGQSVPTALRPPAPKGVPWYTIKNNANADTAEVMIYDEVGYYAVNAAEFARDLRAITAPKIDLRLNSPGGEVFEGIAIMEALKRHPAKVTVYVDGVAASIASVIAMAGDKIIMTKNSTMMIHDASGICFGNAADMKELAALLDKISNNLASIYADRAGTGAPATWRNRMKATTWYSAAEAVNAGLADEVDSGKSAATNHMDALEFGRLMREAIRGAAEPSWDVGKTIRNAFDQVRRERKA